MIKTLIVAASVIAFSGAVMATEVPKSDAKTKCVASSTVKCPEEPKKTELKKVEEKKTEVKKTEEKKTN
jgi:hypothetical protein